MKNVFILFLLMTFRLQAQDPLSLQWLRNEGAVNYDHASGLVYADGYLYLCGYFSGTLNGQASAGGTDAFVSKYDPAGNLIWQRSFGGSGEDRAHQLCFDKVGGRLILTGFFEGKMYFGQDSLSSVHREDIFLVSLDSSGNWLWGNSFGGPGSQSASSVYADGAQNISISGYFEDTLSAGAVTLVSRGIRNAFVLKTDSNGQCLWGHRMGGLLYDEGLNIIGDDHDNIYISGYYRDTADFGPFAARSVFTYDCFLVSLNAAGDWRWLRSFGGGYVDNCPALAYMPQSGQILTAGWFFNDIRFSPDTVLYSVGEEESFMAAFDTLGSLNWSQRIGNNFAELIYDLSVDENDNILAIGTFDSIIRIGRDTLIARHYNKPTDLFALGFTPEGKYSWGLKAGAEFNDFGFHAAWGDSSNFYLGGNFLNKTIFQEDTLFSNGNYDIYLAKYHLDTANIKPNAIEAVGEKALTFRLYPNPAEDRINLEHNCVENGLQLEVFDLLGRLQKKDLIWDGVGQIDLKGLQPGYYIIRMICGTTSEQFRVLLRG